MSLFVRRPSCIFQCTQRMVHDFISSNFNANRSLKFSTKQANSQFIQSNDTIISNKLKSNEEIADGQWVEIRKELLKSYQKYVTETSVDSVIFDLCTNHERKDQAVKYYKFLVRNNYEISLNILGRYLKFLSEDQEISKTKEEEICQIYQEIRKKYTLLDAKTCTSCILALSITKQWNEGFKLLKMLKFSGNPGTTVVITLCKAAFKNDKPEYAWKLINESSEKFPMPHEVYLQYLDYCKRNFEGKNLEKEIEKMFYFWRKNYVKPVDFVLEKYMETFSALGYKTTFTSIHNEKMCSECHITLKDATLSKSEFKTLSISVLKKLIVKKNVYQTTSPKELKRYMHFVKNLQPYDVIIDGLNVAFSHFIQNRGSLDNILYVVDKLLKKYSKILVIGRLHMIHWSSETMRKIEEKADVFLLENATEDDPFLIHLALVSGPQTYFVSRDFMRQHLHRLEEDDLQKLFYRWKLSRQYLVEWDSTLKKLILIPPSSIETNAQKVENGWHIPSTRNKSVPLPVCHTIPRLWACMVKTKHLKNTK